MGTSGDEGMGDGGSAVGARQFELRANSGLAAGTTRGPAVKQVQVHCIFFLLLKVCASRTTIFLCQKEQPSLVSSPVSPQQDALRLKP